MTSFTVENVLKVLSVSLNRTIVFLILVATALFLWGVVKYVSAGADEKRIEEARRIIIYGIIGFVVSIAVWGFVYVVIDFVFNTKNIPTIPGVNVVKPL